MKAVVLASFLLCLCKPQHGIFGRPLLALPHA